MINKNIEFIRDVSWEEVFLFWYINEGENEKWQKLSIERGFYSWADWRVTYAESLGCREAKWSLYDIESPGIVIGNFYGGPFKTWVDNYYCNSKSEKFFDLISNPAVTKLPAVKEIAKEYPINTTIICLEVQDKIYVIEGMHRSCALMIRSQLKLSMPKIRVAIGKSKLSDLPIVGQNTKKLKNS